MPFGSSHKIEKLSRKLWLTEFLAITSCSKGKILPKINFPRNTNRHNCHKVICKYDIISLPVQ